MTWLDVRHGIRMLRRHPGFTSLAVLTMALGIGATTTLASVAYNVLMRPLPFPTAARLVQLSEVREGSTRVLRPLMSNATYLAWQDDPATLDAIGAWSTETVTVTAEGQPPERLTMGDCSASLFTVLGARPLVGALFTASDEATRDEDVAMIAYDLWQRRYNGRADVVGQVITLDGHRRTILGVMPRDFAFPDRETSLWAPLRVPSVVTDNGRRVSVFDAIGLLRPGVTAQQASDEGTARAHAAPDLGMTGIAVFGSRGAAVVTARPLIEAMTADVRPALLLFLGAVGLLLLAAVANISSLQLARVTARRREIAIRAALGAGRGRIARQLLVDSSLVGVAGGLAGLLLAFWLHRLLPILLPADFPRAADVAIDWRVATFALALSVGASLLFGLLPSLFAWRVTLVPALVEDSLAPVGGGLRGFVARMRAGILAGQVAIAVMLLISAALLSRSFIALRSVDRGYEPSHLLTAQIPLPAATYTGVRRAQVLGSVMDRLRAVPGVTHVATTGVLPLMRGEMLMSFTLPPTEAGKRPEAVQALPRIVSADYFAALGMRLTEGRGFGHQDSLTSEPVVVVNRTFVRMYLGERALGKTLPVSFSEGKNAWRVTGVVDDVRHRGATDPPRPEIYACECQIDAGVETSTPILLARTTGDPEALVPTLRSLVSEADPAVALQSVLTMDDRVAANLASPRLDAVLVAAFALLAALIAVVGLFGVLSHTVAQRVREIGVRTALGATPGAIVRLVAGQGLAVTAVGLIAGLGASFLLARELETFLFGVGIHDAASFVLVPLALLGVAALACALPARRAARIDPLKALRE